MTEFNILDDHAHRALWQGDFGRRLRASYAAAGLTPAAVDRMLEDTCAEAADWTVAEITDAGSRVGHVAVVVAGGDGTRVGRIKDLCVDAPHGGRGHDQAARCRAEGWAAQRGARRLDVRLTEPAADLFDAYQVRCQLRTKRVDSPPWRPVGFTARPMTPAEYPEWATAETSVTSSAREA